MSHDSWSGIFAKRQSGVSDSQIFQNVQSGAPSVMPENGYFGFRIEGVNKAIARAFVAKLNHATTILRHSVSGDVVSVKFLSVEVGERLSKAPISFKVDNKFFMAVPCTLRKVEQKQDVYDRILSGDITLFDISRTNVVRNITTDDVLVRYIVSDSGEIYVFYRERTNRHQGINADDRWNFFSFVEGKKSEIDVMDWRDNSPRHVDVHLLRIAGIQSGGNDTLSEKRIAKFERPLDPTNPPVKSQLRECVGIFRGDKGKESFSKLGENCLPIGIQALETGRNLVDEIPAGYDWVPTKEQAFWARVTIDRRLKADYLEKQSKKASGFGRGRKRKNPIRETETVGGF